MKKTLIMTILFFLLISMLTVTKATEDPDQEKKIDSVNILSAKRGLLEFEKGITRNLLKGEVVLRFIEQNHPDVDVSELTNALQGLSGLRDEVKQVDIEDTEPEVIKNWFPKVLKEYKGAVLEFREEAEAILSETDTSKLLQELEETDLSVIDELNQKIAQLNKKLKAETNLICPR